MCSRAIARSTLALSFLLVRCGQLVPVDAAEPRELLGKEWVTSCFPSGDAFAQSRARYEGNAVRWTFRQHADAHCTDAPSEELVIVRTGYFRRVTAAEYVFQSTGGNEQGTDGSARAFAERRSVMPSLEISRVSTFHLLVTPSGELTQTVRGPGNASASIRLTTATPGASE